jgi:hypothetical protein
MIDQGPSGSFFCSVMEGSGNQERALYDEIIRSQESCLCERSEAIS